MEWIASHTADVVAIAVLAVVLFFAARSTFGGSALSCEGCSGDCSGCGGSCSAAGGLKLSAEQQERLRALRESRAMAHESM